MNAQRLQTSDVQVRIAEAIERHIGVERDLVLAGTSFLELHSDFDSLTFLELQLILEEEYGFEFDRDSMTAGAKMPMNVVELAEVVIEHQASFVAKQAEKQARKAARVGVVPAGKPTT